MAAGKGTSTDKLLEMIRGKGGAESAPAGGAAPAGAPAAPPARKKAAAKPAAKPAAKKAPAKAAAQGGKAGKGAKGRPAKKGKPKPKAAKGKKVSVSGGSSKGAVVGVDIGPDSLRLSKMSSSGSRKKLLAYKRVPYDQGVSPESPEFAGFLRSKLKEFVRSPRVEIWSLVSSAKAELWNITIPKVSKRQIIEAVYWSVKKEKQFDESEFILDFDVLGEVSEKGVPKIAVTVYLAPRKQVEEVTNLFAKAGYKLTGVTIAPIALQTIFRTRWLDTKARTYANLYVGRNWSRIDIFNKGNLVLSRGIKAGTNSMIEALVDSYNTGVGGGGGQSISLETVIEEDAPVISMDLSDEEPQFVASETMDPSQRSAMDFEQAKRVMAVKMLNDPRSLSGSGSELSEREVVDMILPAAERLVRQIERTFEYHSTTMGNEPVEQIFFSGAICTNKLLLQYMYSQLGIESLILDPLSPENPNVGRIAVPEAVVERLEYNLVVALSLSDNSYTPNLLYTYKEKDKVEQAQRLDKIILGIAGLVLCILVGVYWWQSVKISGLEAEKAVLEQKKATYHPLVTEAMLTKMANEVSELNMRLKKASLRYESLAAVSQITSLTPNEIKLLDVKMEFGPYKEPVSAEDAKKPNKSRRRQKQEHTDKLIILEGFIQGKDVESFDNALTRYIIKLENSEMFTVPIIDTQEVIEFAPVGTVLKFLIHFNQR